MDNYEVNRAINFLNKHYPDSRVNSNKSIVGNAKQKRVISKRKYIRTGMKQSKIHFVRFASCIFENVALTGSQFRYVTFDKNVINGSSFAYCDFFNTEFYGTKIFPFVANNFSSSNFEGCHFSNIQFMNSGMLNSLFHNCKFKNTVFQSSTLEGSNFINSKIEFCDFSSVNVEFTTFSKTNLNKVKFPFYQFPYVIGAAEYMATPNSTVELQADEKIISMSEYKKQIDHLILFYWDKHEYFPMCNLAIAKNDMEEAQRYLLDGISAALQGHNRDFRMVRYFCQLALHHNILNEFMRHRILEDIDDFLLRKDVPEPQLYYYMTYIESIRTLLHEGGMQSVSLHFNIKTNVQRDDAAGVRYINNLLSELNETLSQAEGKDGFRVAVANYSPYQIVIDVISTVGSVASIASLIWMSIDAIKSKRYQHNLIKVDTDTYRDYVNAKIDCMRADLFRLQKKYSKRKFNQYIDEITQNLKTDLEELYTKDVMIFKVDNHSSTDKKK